MIAEELSKALVQEIDPFDGKFDPERKVYCVRDESAMLDQAVHYYQSSLEQVTQRWDKIKKSYPGLKRRDRCRIWPLYENAWEEV